LYLNHFSTKNIPASLFSKLHSATFNFGFLKGFLVPKLMMSAWKNCGLAPLLKRLFPISFLSRAERDFNPLSRRSGLKWRRKGNKELGKFAFWGRRGKDIGGAWLKMADIIFYSILTSRPLPLTFFLPAEKE